MTKISLSKVVKSRINKDIRKSIVNQLNKYMLMILKLYLRYPVNPT